MRVGNQDTTINNKVRAIEQIFVRDPVNLNIFDYTMCITNNHVCGETKFSKT